MSDLDRFDDRDDRAFGATESTMQAEEALSLEPLAKNTDFLEAIVVFLTSPSYVYGSWVKQNAPLSIASVSTYVGETYMQATRAAQRIESAAHADTESAPLVTIEDANHTTISSRIRGFVVTLIFERRAPLGLSRAHTARILKALSSELPQTNPSVHLRVSQPPVTLAMPAREVMFVPDAPAAARAVRMSAGYEEHTSATSTDASPVTSEQPAPEAKRPHLIPPPPVADVIPPVASSSAQTASTASASTPSASTASASTASTSTTSPSGGGGPSPLAASEPSPPRVRSSPSASSSSSSYSATSSSSSSGSSAASSASRHQSAAPESSSGVGSAAPETPSEARAMRIIAYVEATSIEPHISVLRLALRSGISVEGLRDLRTLSVEQLLLLETAAEEMLGLDRGKLVERMVVTPIAMLPRGTP